MKVFLSWSGELSHKVALVLRDWLPSVIQSLEPYVSSEDIDKGARWSTDIAKELEKSSYGILCITRENMEAPWLNFEAGALSKSIDKSRVSPFLFGIKRSDVKPGPLLQFQSTVAERDDVLKLLQSLNGAHEPPLLELSRLETVFDVWWPRLESKLAENEKVVPKVVEVADAKHLRSNGGFPPEIIEEILVLLRQQQRLLNSPSDLLPPAYIRDILGHRDIDLEIGHPAFDDLEESWNELRTVLSQSIETNIFSRESTARALAELEGPIGYIVRRYSGIRGRNRRERPPLKRDLP